MSLLEDIRAERAQTSNEIRSLARLVFVEMCSNVNESHGCRPVVAALVDGQAELHFPTWNTEFERSAAFDSISKGLIERQAQAAVTAFSARLSTDSNEVIDKAVVVIIQTHDWRQMNVYPYIPKQTGVEWTKPFIVDEIDSPLVEISCAN